MVEKNATILTKDGKELIVRNPTLSDIRAGKRVYNTAFQAALDSNALVRARLDDFLNKQGLWNEEKAAKLEALKKEILENEYTLEKGGIKLAEAKKIALHMIKLRSDIRSLMFQRTQLDGNSAEGQAENSQFDYLVSACLVYKDSGKPYFENLDSYLNSEENVGLQAAQQLSARLNDFDENYESKLPEYRFLKRFHFINEKLHFINDDNKLVDVDGRLVNEFGNWVDSEGHLVDKEGRRVDDDGNYIADFTPFLDNDGKPIIEKEEVVPPSTPIVEDTVTVEVDSDLE